MLPVRQLLAQYGLSPKKSFGQNFMVDSNFAAAVAREAAPDERTLIVEIGPGTGCLTRAILNAHPKARVLAIEIDARLAQLLRDEFKDALAEARLSLLEGDALAGKHELSPQLVTAIATLSLQENRPRRVLCANLPYNAATPLLANLAIDAQQVAMETAVATIQLELAERILAQAGDEAFGALSVLMALRARSTIVRKVGGEIFWPRPTVDSAVLRLDFMAWPPSTDAGLSRAEADAFRLFLHTLFSKRRKMLRAVIKPARVPAELNLAPDARAENLAPEVLLKLYRRLNPPLPS